MLITTEKLDKGDWEFTYRLAGFPLGATIYRLLKTAHDWGCRPSDVGICEPAEDLAYMAAFTETQSLMASYESQIQEKERKRKTARSDTKRAKGPSRIGSRAG